MTGVPSGSSGFICAHSGVGSSTIDLGVSSAIIVRGLESTGNTGTGIGYALHGLGYCVGFVGFKIVQLALELLVGRHILLLDGVLASLAVPRDLRSGVRESLIVCRLGGCNTFLSATHHGLSPGCLLIALAYILPGNGEYALCVGPLRGVLVVASVVPILILPLLLLDILFYLLHSLGCRYAPEYGTTHIHCRAYSCSDHSVLFFESYNYVAKIQPYICKSILSSNYMRGKKTGGRQKGTPNKDNPIRGYLLSHSVKYFEPNEANADGLSDFEADLALMTPEDRVLANIRILKFHTSELKSIDVDMTVAEHVETIDERLARLAIEDEPDSDPDPKE